MFGQQLAKAVRVVGFVGNQAPDGTDGAQQLRSEGDIVKVARSQEENVRPSGRIGQDVELRRPAAA